MIQGIMVYLKKKKKERKVIIASSNKIIQKSKPLIIPGNFKAT